MKILQAARNVCFRLFSLSLICVYNIGHALPFNIFPKSETTLPTQVPTGGKAYAYYTVLNNTSSARPGNFVKRLPLNVTQVTSGGTYTDTCGTTFDLPAKGSCTLQLAITGDVQASDPNPDRHLFVCFPGGVSCAGTSFPLNVRARSWAWNQNKINSQSTAIYIADIASLGQDMYAGGVENLVILGIDYFAGELWRLTSLSPFSWSKQYKDALALSKVSSLISNADHTSLFSSTGNNGFAGVDRYTPGMQEPVSLSGIELLATAVQDLELGEDNVLFAAGATRDFPPIGEVWTWNESTNIWTPTNFSAQKQGTAFWITYSSPSSSAPGLYVAATNRFGSNPVVFQYRFASWTDAQLPLERMNSLQAMNTDAQDSLYVVGSITNGEITRGSILKNLGDGRWETIPSPSNSKILSTVSFSVPANFIYVGGINSAGVGAVWYSSDRGASWLDTQLPNAASVTALGYNNGILYAGGSLAGVYGAAIWSLLAP